MYSLPRIPTVASLALTATVCVASAQESTVKLIGRVIEEGNRDVIAGAAVRIGDASSVTDRNGRFVASVPRGAHLITIERIGYTTRQDTIRLENATSDLEIRLSRKPVPLPALTVVGRSEWLEQNGLYERRQEGGLHGRYIMAADIERRAPTFMTDLFYDVPGVKVQYRGMGKRLIRFNRTPAGGLLSGGSNRSMQLGGCDPAVYVDGRRHVDKHPTLDPALEDFNFLSPIVIEAIEIYVGNAPLEFKSDCGSIVIWTRRGSSK